MILYLLDLIIGALVAEFARYLFAGYIKVKVQPHLPQIYGAVDKNIVSLVVNGVHSFPYPFTIFQEVSKIPELNKGFVSWTPVRNYIIRLIQRDFDPSILLNRIKDVED